MIYHTRDILFTHAGKQMVKIGRVLLLVSLGLGLQALVSSALGDSFSTSFDLPDVESNEVSILSCPSPDWKPGQPCPQISVITWSLGKTWPDNRFQRKLRLDLSNRRSGGVMITRDMALTGHQHASVQFYAPGGISDHIVLGLLGENIPAKQITGYFAIVGHDLKRLGQGYRLAIEKATPAANWLFPGRAPDGGIPFPFSPGSVYKLSIAASYDATTVRIDALVHKWVSGTGWNKVANVQHTDGQQICEPDTTGNPEGYCPTLTGGNVFFGAIFQDKPVYFDQFSLKW